MVQIRRICAIIFFGGNRHQLDEKPINLSRGEGGGERRGGPLWSPVVAYLFPLRERIAPTPAGDHKGPPFPASSTLAPTESWATS